MYLYWQTWISLGYVRSSPRHWDRGPAKGLVREEGRDAFIGISQGRAHPRASPENGVMLFDLVPIFEKKKKRRQHSQLKWVCRVSHLPISHLKVRNPMFLTFYVILGLCFLIYRWE